MNWAYALLGVPDDIDAMGVKRAYARLLKTTRPDDDAEAFQRLHAAYQLVLAQANQRQQESVAAPSQGLAQEEPQASAPEATGPIRRVHVGADRAMPPPSTDEPVRRVLSRAESNMPPLPPAETVAVVSAQVLAQQVIEQAVTSTDQDALAQWLNIRPEFWAIRTKQQTGQWLLQHLFRTPQPMAPHSLDVLLQFFDLEQVLAGVNPIALAQLRQRQQAMWYVLPHNNHALAQRMILPGRPAPDVRMVRSSLRLLETPLRWPHVAWQAIRRGRAGTNALLIHVLCGGLFDQLPGRIDRRQAEFWCRAAQISRPSWPRFIVGSIRAVFVGTLLLFGVTLASMLPAGPGSTNVEWSAAWETGAFIASVAVSIWLIQAGWMWLVAWQGRGESIADRSGWWRRGFIPLLCAACLATDYLLHSGVAAMCIIGPTFVLALRRYRHRRPANAKRKIIALASSLPGIGFVLIVLVNLGAGMQPEFVDQVPLVAISVSATLGIWLMDLWRHRSWLKRQPKS